MALTDNLISFWELEETSGTRVDAHGANDLTDNNTVLSGTGKVGTAADFERTNVEYLSITDASQSGLDLSGDLSFSVWLNFESLPTNSAGNFYRHIIDKWTTASNRSYRLIHQNEGTEQFAFIASSGGVSVTYSGTYNTSLSTATWYHLVMTFNASTGAIEWYLNGTNVKSETTSTGSIFNGTSPFFLGTNAGSTAFDGLMDQAGVWSRAITASEVTSLYNTGSGLSYADMSAPPATGSPHRLLMMGCGI